MNRVKVVLDTSSKRRDFSVAVICWRKSRQTATTTLSSTSLVKPRVCLSHGKDCTFVDTRLFRSRPTSAALPTSWSWLVRYYYNVWKRSGAPGLQSLLLLLKLPLRLGSHSATSSAAIFLSSRLSGCSLTSLVAASVVSSSLSSLSLSSSVLVSAARLGADFDLSSSVIQKRASLLCSTNAESLFVPPAGSTISSVLFSSSPTFKLIRLRNLFDNSVDKSVLSLTSIRQVSSLSSPPSLLSSSSLFSSSPSTQSSQVRRLIHTSAAMAKSKFEYVKQFETEDTCMPNCWLVVRIDGKAFHKFTNTHHYMKPNDERGLSLMTKAAQNVMNEFNEIVLAYGQSDEYSFVFHKNCKVYNRRSSKIMTNVVSLFASSFTLYWNRFFNMQELQYPPSFDARVVLYPSEENLRDYLSWRQADCHINNLYNTCFWKLVQEKGLSPAQAEGRLKGTLSSDKNELLFSEFNINYNNLPELYRKGSVVIRPVDSGPQQTETNHRNHTSDRRQLNSSFSHSSRKATSIVLHTDIIGKKFWEDYPHILIRT